MAMCGFVRRFGSILRANQSALASPGSGIGGGNLMQRRWLNEEAGEEEGDEGRIDPPMVRRRPQIPPNNSLYISNIPFKVEAAQLSEPFRKHGEIERVTILRDREGRSRGRGFVTFTELAHASKALADLEGQNFMGRTMRIVYAYKRTTSPDGTFRVEDGSGRASRRRSDPPRAEKRPQNSDREFQSRTPLSTGYLTRDLDASYDGSTVRQTGQADESQERILFGDEDDFNPDQFFFDDDSNETEAQDVTADARKKKTSSSKARAAKHAEKEVSEEVLDTESNEDKLSAAEAPSAEVKTTKKASTRKVAKSKPSKTVSKKKKATVTAADAKESASVTEVDDWSAQTDAALTAKEVGEDENGIEEKPKKRGRRKASA